MSILLIEFLPQGIIFGADRNITHCIEKFGTTKVEVHGQTQERKVLRWPNRKALIGYVGAAEIGGISTAEWLYDFVGDHLNFDSLESLATSLCSKVQTQRFLDEKGASPELLNLHIAGFEEREQTVIPSCTTFGTTTIFNLVNTAISERNLFPRSILGSAHRRNLRQRWQPRLRTTNQCGFIRAKILARLTLWKSFSGSGLAFCAEADTRSIVSLKLSKIGNGKSAWLFSRTRLTFSHIRGQASSMSGAVLTQFLSNSLATAANKTILTEADNGVRHHLAVRCSWTRC